MRSRLLAFGILVGSAPAFAGGGMPQMDPTWFANGFVWLAVSFALLYIAVSRFISPTISGVLAARETAIEGAIREAEKAKAEAESGKGDASTHYQSARAKAAEVMAQMQADVSKESASEMAKLDRELARKAEQAQVLLSDALAKAEGSIQSASESLAQAMVEKLLGTPASQTGARESATILKLATKR